PRLEALFQAIVEQIAAWSGFSIVSIEVLDAAHTDVVPVAAVGLSSEVPVSGSVALTGESLVDRDVLAGPTRASPALLQSGARTSVDGLIALAVDRLAAAFAPGRASYASIEAGGLLRVVRSTSPDERYAPTKADLTAVPDRLASLREGGALVVDDVAADPEIE